MPRVFQSHVVFSPPSVLYAGPGDIVSGALSWWGLRAYSLASIGSNAIRLRATDTTELDIATVAGGGLDPVAIASITAHGTPLTIAKMYDQSGNGRDLSQATAASQPVFTPNAIGTLPAIDCSGATPSAGFFFTSSATLTQAQPYVFSLVYRVTTSNDGVIFDSASNGVQTRVDQSGANQILLFAGNLNNVTAADNATHALQGTFNNTSGEVYLDGTATTVSTGSIGFGAEGYLMLSNSGSGIVFIGLAWEFGHWPGTFTGGQKSDMNSNERTYWGISQVGYTGPGDVVSGASGWWGLRAYSAAKIGSRAVRLRRDSDNVERDFVTLANGLLDTTAITAFKGAANLFVVKAYDQSGNTNDLSQATSSNQPGFSLSVLGSLPAIVGDGANTRISTTALPTFTGITISHVAKNTGVGSGKSDSRIFGSAGNTDGIYSFSGANLYGIFAGGSVTSATCSDNSWHAVQSLFEGASTNGTIVVDGSSTSASGIGTTGIGGTLVWLDDRTGGLNPFLGNSTEIGVWPVLFTSPQLTAMNSNQHSFWGF